MWQIPESELQHRKLRLLQLIANDTPTVPVDTDEWFCILLLRMQPSVEAAAESVPTEPGRYEPLLESILEQLSLSSIPVQYGMEYVILFSGQRQAFMEGYRQTLKNFWNR